MAINQISVFVENNRGKLSAITDLIANSGVDIRALSIGDSSDFGVLRMIVSDAPKAKAALEAGHHLVSITKVSSLKSCTFFTSSTCSGILPGSETVTLPLDPSKFAFIVKLFK